MRNLLTLLALCLLAVTAAADERAGKPLESWTVVGIRDEASPDLGDEIATLRGALSLELSARGRGVVRDEDATRLRLGAPGADLRPIRDRIDAAELYYFQLELEIARSNLEQALAELGHASGIPAAWEHTREARMLLAMIQLARRTPEGDRLADEQLTAVARVQPDWNPAQASYPADVIERFADARRSLDAPRGTLRALCAPACPGGHVYVDTFPVAAAGEAIELPPGRYRVVVTDEFESPRRRSLVRDVEVRAGVETGLQVDLAVEGRLVAQEGTALVVAADEATRRQAAAQIAKRLGADFTLVLLATAQGDREGWLVDGGGQVVREMALTGSSDEAAVQLARLAVSDAVPAARPAVASVGAPVVATRVESPAATGRGGIPAGWTAVRWTSAGGAILATSLGLYFRIDAANRHDALAEQIDGWGGVLPSEGAARTARTEADAIRSQEQLGNGVLIGAGVFAATALTLFLLDFEETEPVVRW